MTSRLSLLLGASGLAVIAFGGCSSPDDGEPESGNPFAGATGTNPFAGAAGQQAGVGGGTGVAQGGSGALPTGQGGANQGLSGAAGAPGVGGSTQTGVGGAGGIVTGTGTTITPDAMGWVTGASNMFGIQGSFYTFSDATGTPPGTSTISATPDFTGGRVCVQGSGAAVALDPATMMPAYSQYWGAGVGFNLADPGTMTGPGPWTRGAVTGFSFTITGTQIPPGLQFRFKASPIEGATANPNYCVSGVAMGANTFHFNQILLDCYGPSTTPIPDAAPLQDIQWQIATVETGPTPFNFCIENLTPITTP